MSMRILCGSVAQKPQFHRLMTSEGREKTDRLEWLVGSYLKRTYRCLCRPRPTGAGGRNDAQRRSLQDRLHADWRCNQPFHDPRRVRIGDGTLTPLKNVRLRSMSRMVHGVVFSTESLPRTRRRSRRRNRVPDRCLQIEGRQPASTTNAPKALGCPRRAEVFPNGSPS